MTTETVNRGTGRNSPWDDEFARFFGERAHSLRATAYRLCGDWHHAEDITQAALVKLYQAWPRISHHEALDAYARKVVLNTFLAENRRAWRRREQLTETVPEVGSAAEDVEDRAIVLRALAGVAPKQQAVLMLRYWHDLSVEETAAELGCSTGTVKSQSARALATLRKRLGPHFAVLATAAATAIVIIVILLGIGKSATTPQPLTPAVPPQVTSTTSTPTTPGEPRATQAPTLSSRFSVGSIPAVSPRHSIPAVSPRQ